ncbi:MAG TPA: uroporphyrinogen-III C-methyltransferase [Solirubrobacteraceae bacterium]|jgi:uroporphyrinogen III methyltransferase/synthase|nr:uroporphyrinogen-III C-methyltransferase [Solirubrobacteraceae bacterium]
MTGRVYLVGAGPGDPGLLTARALELIATADVILYDRLIPSGALDGARTDAELLFVGKEGGGPSVPQEQTEALLIERAQAGKTVVRLKGGDPFVFGRGGEEALALRDAGIDFEVVPGVTAGIAASAYAGIPVTHRGLSTAVALVTGHTQAGADGSPDGEQAEINWPALAAFPGTLVLYMGVRQLPHIAASLIASGRPGSQPAAVVQDGTLPTQRTVRGTLETIAEIAHEQNVRPPSITVIGPVAALAEEIAWLTPRPLRGLSVAVTRARAQASGLAQKLQALGAAVVQAPVIRVQPLSDPAQPTVDPSPYDLICLASPNAVAALFERLNDGIHPLGDARSLAAAKIAAIGPGTARALAGHGVVADVVPERFVAESLVEALAEIPVERVLIAQAREARDVLADALRARGAEVDVVALYETIAGPLSERTLEAVAAADYITFTSSSTVRFLLQASSQAEAPLAPSTRIVSIGPITSETLREHGLEPHVEADPYDVEGMIAALLADVATRASDDR